MLKVNRNDKKDEAASEEMEFQFILRMPQAPAKELREAIRAGSVHLKDRLQIKLEYDMRYGEVRFDDWLLHAKVVDLPTVVESLKTIDKKSFYKTADICQMLICREEDDHTTTDEESPSKTKKKDPNKVDKKFLWPHGITPPMKNVRRRRFRKTLRKKYVEAPEIEKEVKRLLRVDNDAVQVKWEVICEEDDRKGAGIGIKTEPGIPGGQIDNSTPSFSGTRQMGVGEHDIFGEAVSDSEDEEGNINIMEVEEESRPSAEDSRLSDSASLHGNSSVKGLVTQFSHEMFMPARSSTSGLPKSNIKMEHSLHESAPSLINFNVQNIKEESSIKIKSEHPSSGVGPSSPLPYAFEVMATSEGPPSTHQETSDMLADDEYMEQTLTKPEVLARMQTLSQHLASLNKRRQQQELEISNIENQTLRQRFQEILDNLMSEQLDKQQEYEDLATILQQYE